MKRNKSRVVALLLSAMMIVTMAAPASASTATYYTSDYASKAEAVQAGLDLNLRIAQEGMILLKNENNALPLAKGSKVTMLGYAGYYPNAGASANGGDASAGAAFAQATVVSSMTESGFELNPAVSETYAGVVEETGASSDMDLWSAYAAVYPYWENSFAEYGDAAIVVLRSGSGDGLTHRLQFDKVQMGMIDYAAEHFEKVIVLLNNVSVMEMQALQNNDKIDAILSIGEGGDNGFAAVGPTLCGEITPSGRTVDTWAVDLTQNPSYVNFNVNTDANAHSVDGAGTATGYTQFVVDGQPVNTWEVGYEEGIYVGYRYYETRGYEEAKTGNEGWYAQNVSYPFGYGLSYTTFDWDVKFDKADGSAIHADDTLGVTVTVKNTGSVAGKDVVQLYYSAPYDYEGNAIEKPYVVLGDFVKTNLLQPGESQEMKLSLKVSDMKSYDYADANQNGFAGYELDAGSYQLFVSSDAHTPKASATYDLGEAVQLATELNAQGEEVAVENRFDDVSAGIYGTNTYASYVTRKDFEGTLPQTYLADEARTLTDSLMSALDESKKRKYTASDEGQPWQVTDGASEVTPVNNGISLRAMLEDSEGNLTDHVDFDDPRWEQLLDEISLDEMKNLVGFGAFRTNSVAGVDGIVDKPMTIDADGPSGFTSFISEADVYGTCLYQAEAVMGATWNVELARQMGEIVGDEGNVGNEKTGVPYSGWYAPAVNIHRSPFAGRNWEYYSEDGLLSGKLAANVVQGAQSKGLYCYVKHFAVNDQETDREYNGILVWANEQAMRELYLKPFEIAIKEGGAHGIMSSFNRLGMTWAGGSYPLLTSVLRDEWGFHGMVITDYSLNTYTHVDEMIRAGGDLFLTQDTKKFYKDDDATQIALLRQATKNILYTVVNSNAMNIETTGYLPPLWQVVWQYAQIGLIALLAVWGVLAFVTARKKDKKAK